MRRLGSLWLWVTVSASAAAQPVWLAQESIERRAVADPQVVLESSVGPARWLGWSAPAREHRDLCCYDGGFRRRGCTLEGRSASFSVSEAKAAWLGEPALVLLARAEGGSVTALRLMSPDCPVDAGSEVVLWLDGVQPEAGLTLLHRLASGEGERRGGKEDVPTAAIAAIAQHGGAAPDRLLAELAAPGQVAGTREEAIFWLGEARGRAGFEVLSGLVADEQDEELLEQLAFALQLSPVPEATVLLGRLAREDPRSELRRNALFWLSQEGEPGIEAMLSAAATADPDAEVREQAVFALSQLPDERAVDGLLALLRTADDREIQRQALFWLSQSEEPRALAAVERLLDE